MVNGRGYDHNFVLNAPATGWRSRPACYEPKTGRVMEVSTTEPGIQFYTGNFLDDARRHGRTGSIARATASAWRRSTSPIRRTSRTSRRRAQPGETYKSTTVHKFSTDAS